MPIDSESLRRRDEQPFREAGYPAGPVSMGGGRILEYGTCPKRKRNKLSKNRHHRYVAVSCIQSVEHFVCEYCEDSYYD